MKKSIVLFLLTSLISAFAGSGEPQSLREPAETQPVTVNEEEYDASDELKRRLERHIAIGEYGKAVSLAEENIETVNADREKFEGILDDIFIHFSHIAKMYYTNTSTYVTKQQVMGYDYDTGFEGYDPESGTIDPHAFEDYLSNDERVALERVNIKVTNTDLNYFDVKVSIEICGMTAVYPPEDEMLK